MKKLILLTLILSSVLFAKNTMSQKSYEQLMEAQKLIEANETKKAKDILNKILKVKNSYSQSYAYQYLSNLALNDGDYTKAKEYFEKIIELNAFEKKSINNIKLSLAKMHLYLEEYNPSIKISLELLNEKNIKKVEVYENLVYGYYYTKKFKDSIKYAKKYIEQTKKKKENIYQLLYSSYIEIKDYNNAIISLETMIKNWSDKQNYWLQLISLYQQTKKYKKALSTIELSYKEKILDPNKHTLFFANLLLQNDLYQKGSLVLESGIKKGYIKEDKKIFNLLVSSYINAKEYDKAIKKLENSKFSKKYKLKKILANLYYEKHDYKNAIKVIKKIHHKKTKIDGELHILLALCHYELENTKECKISLQKALHSKKSKHRAMQIAKALRIQLDKVN